MVKSKKPIVELSRRLLILLAFHLFHIKLAFFTSHDIFLHLYFAILTSHHHIVLVHVHVLALELSFFLACLCVLVSKMLMENVLQYSIHSSLWVVAQEREDVGVQVGLFDLIDDLHVCVIRNLHVGGVVQAFVDALRGPKTNFVQVDLEELEAVLVEEMLVLVVRLGQFVLYLVHHSPQLIYNGS